MFLEIGSILTLITFGGIRYFPFFCYAGCTISMNFIISRNCKTWQKRKHKRILHLVSYFISFSVFSLAHKWISFVLEERFSFFQIFRSRFHSACVLLSLQWHLNIKNYSYDALGFFSFLFFLYKRNATNRLTCNHNSKRKNNQ